jgi:elongation factor G
LPGKSASPGGADSIARVRNIGIVAHIDAGKTTTTERILYYSGHSHRLGSVDDGTTVTDFDPDEARRGITIYSAAITCRWHETTINIIDTPGHVDFTAEVERSLRVLDGAVMIFSSVEGVEAQSETVWRQADRYDVPRVCFINKLDRIGASFERTFDQIIDRLGGQPLALQLPLGEGPLGETGEGFRAVIDLVGRRVLRFDAQEDGSEITVEEVPEEKVEEVESWRRKLLEAVVLLDDDVLETYVETDDVPTEEIHRLLREGTLAGTFQPTVCGSALDCIGVQPLLDAIISCLPSPLDRPAVVGIPAEAVKLSGKQARRQARKAALQGGVAEEVAGIERLCDPDAAFCGLVFKVQADTHGDLCFLRIYSGTLVGGSRVVNARTGDKELINQIWRVQADNRERIETDRAIAGDIVGVIGPKVAVTGDTLCEPGEPVLLESIEFPETVISMAVEPDTSAERKKLAETLERLARQDPTFTAHVSEDTGQTIISGMGELHLEVIRERIQREFGLSVTVHKPRVSYRESIRKPAEVTGEFQRTSAGVSQFARVRVSIEPISAEGPAELDVRFDTSTLTPVLAEALVQSLHDELAGGGVLGYPLISLRVALLEVEARVGETTEVALHAAVSDAMHRLLTEAGVVLLEPVMQLEVVTPDDFLGPLQADLNARHAVIVNSMRRGDLAVLNAEVALSRMFGYSTQARSLSQGRATYSMQPLKYREAPRAVLETMLG